MAKDGMNTAAGIGSGAVLGGLIAGPPGAVVGAILGGIAGYSTEKKNERI